MPNLIPSLSDAYWTGKPTGYASTIVYGSARSGLVSAPDTDAAYLAWQAIGHAAWPWPVDASGATTIAALDAVLTSGNLPATGLLAPTPAELVAYAEQKRATIENGGTSINLGTAEAPLMISVDTTATGIANLCGLTLQATLNASFVATWFQASGHVTLSSAQITALATAVAAWVASVYAVEASAVAATLATPPTITTFTEVDALAWPRNG